MLSDTDVDVDPPTQDPFASLPPSPCTRHRVVESGGFVLFVLSILTGAALLILWWQDILFTSSSGPQAPPVVGTSPGEPLYPLSEYLTWKDTSNVTIQAHGGGILIDPFDGSYWWVGETEKLSDTSVRGINLYHSIDLVMWVFEGKILSLTDLPAVVNGQIPIIMERPKMIYHSQTQMYVMWLHIDNAAYSWNVAGVATSSSPTGPWKLQSISQPDGLPIKDLTVYVSASVYEAYLVYSAYVSGEWVLGLSALSYDSGWTRTTGTLTTFIPYALEAPVVWRYWDVFYVMASEMAGWGPDVHYLYSASPVGVLSSSTQWTLMANPFIGDHNTSYGGQTTDVVQYEQPDKLMELVLMMDLWIGAPFPNQQLPNSSYLWLPINFENNAWVVPYVPQVPHPSLNNTMQIVYYEVNTLI
jgi:hypothetical protein